MNNLRTSPLSRLSSCKNLPPLVFFMVHLLHRLYGVDAPGVINYNFRHTFVPDRVYTAHTHCAASVDATHLRTTIERTEASTSSKHFSRVHATFVHCQQFQVLADLNCVGLLCEPWRSGPPFIYCSMAQLSNHQATNAFARLPTMSRVNFICRRRSPKDNKISSKHSGYSPMPANY